MCNVSRGYAVRRKKKSAIDKAKIELDKEWSADVKKLAGFVCEYCGKVDRLNSHHVFTRSNKSTRWYIQNGVCLCAGHHIFFAHKKPIEFIEWLKENRGQSWYDDLVQRKNIRRYK